MFNYVPIEHKQMSFVSNGGKFKLYTVLINVLINDNSEKVLLKIKKDNVHYTLSSYKKKWSTSLLLAFVSAQRSFLSDINYFVCKKDFFLKLTNKSFSYFLL
jgi:hypothetical protein